MLSSHSINIPIALRTNERYFEVYIFHLVTWTFFFFFFTAAFVCSSGLLLPDSKFLLAAKLSVYQIVNYYSISQTFLRWAQDEVFAASTPHVELLYFSVKNIFNYFSTIMGTNFPFFYFKTYSDTGIILHLWLNVLWLHVLLPENYLFLREMVIRYIDMRI